jgi:hypothetical protein
LIFAPVVDRGDRCGKVEREEFKIEWAVAARIGIVITGAFVMVCDQKIFDITAQNIFKYAANVFERQVREQIAAYHQIGSRQPVARDVKVNKVRVLVAVSLTVLRNQFGNNIDSEVFYVTAFDMAKPIMVPARGIQNAFDLKLLK